jgi:hypothetical protein
MHGEIQNITIALNVHRLHIMKFSTRLFEGTVSRDFRPLVFLLNGTPGSPDSWAKAVLNIDSNLRSNSIQLDEKNQLRAMPHSTELIFFVK